ncbi:MAG TPA: hypothetical protein VFJ74_09265, partial [Gemmatimonadaceae bacterium]|nr:hypothetical protein [Gemmatimonadaceae bacterium]
MTDATTERTPGARDGGAENGSVHEPSPFGGAPPGKRGRLARLGLYGGVLAVALVATYLSTRGGDEQPTTASAGHAHAAAP